MNRLLATRISLTLAAVSVWSLLPAGSGMDAATAAPVAPALRQAGSADDAYNQGVELFNKNNFAGAAAAFTKAISIRKGFVDAYFNRGLCYFALKDYDKSISDYSEVIKARPRLADAYLERARAYSAKGSAPQAIADLQQTITLKPALADAYLLRGDVSFQAKDYPSAIKDYTDYITRAGAKADNVAYYNRGLANYYAKSYDPAIADLTQYVTKVTTADSAEGYLDRGNAYAAKKDYANAVADYTKYTTMKPTEAVGFKSRGNVYLLMTPPKYTEANTDFAKVLAITPNDADAQKAMLFIVQKDPNATPEKRLAMASAMLAKNPNDAGALSLRSQALMDKKDYAGAAADYTKLLTARPNDAVALFNRGVAYYNLNQHDKAIADFGTYLATAKDPKDAKAGYEGRALAYMKTQKYAEAVADYGKVIAADPNDANALFNRGIAYYNLGKTDKTAYAKASSDLKAFKTRAKAGDPNVEKADKAIVEIAVTAGDSTEAIAALTSAITSNPNDFNARFNRGVFYLNGKQYDQAVADFSAIITKAATVTDKELLHDAYYSRALAYTQMATPRYAEAAADATQAVTLKPNDPDALITRADANFALKKFPQAAADYNAYLAVKADDTYAIGKLTDSYLQQTPPDYTNAATSLGKLIAKNPDKVEYLKIRGGINLSAKNYAAAITDYNSYIAKNPNDAVAYYNRGLAQAQTKNLAAAAADYEMAVAKNAADFEAAFQAGITYNQLGKADTDAAPEKAIASFDKAVALYDKAAAAAPQVTGANKPTNKRIALVYFNKGVAFQNKLKAQDNETNAKGAIAAFQKYLELDPAADDKAAVQAVINDLKEKYGL